MKKLSYIILLIVVVTISNKMSAQETTQEWRRWSLGASYFISNSWNNNPWNEPHALDDKHSNFQGLSIDVAYRLKLYKALMFHPDISFFFFKQEPETRQSWAGGVTYNEWNLEGYGMNIALPVGFYLPTRKVNFDLETGPVLNLLFNNVYQNLIVSESLTKEIFRDKKFNASWRFSIRASMKMGLYLNVSYDIRMTKFMNHFGYNGMEVVNKPGVFSVGLGYEF